GGCTLAGRLTTGSPVVGRMLSGNSCCRLPAAEVAPPVLRLAVSPVLGAAGGGVSAGPLRSFWSQSGTSASEAAGLAGRLEAAGSSGGAAGGGGGAPGVVGVSD